MSHRLSILLTLAFVTTGCGNRDLEPVAKNRATLRFTIPAAQSANGSSSLEFGLAAPSDGEFSDPNRIVYDSHHLKQYVRWAIDAPIQCGAAEYLITTPDGVVEIQSGLDEYYLGRKFRAQDLVRFLERRVEGDRVEKTITIDDADSIAIGKNNKNTTTTFRLGESPWVRDIRTVISLISQARYAPAYPVLKQLVHDSNPSVRNAAVFALGRLAQQTPMALEDLQQLMSRDDLGSIATDGLKMAGVAAIPILIQSMDHPKEIVRNRAVHALPWIHPFEQAVPGYLAALNHSDPLIRNWGVRAVLDVQSRGIAIENREVINSLKTRAKDAGDSQDTQTHAKIALSNLK